MSWIKTQRSSLKGPLPLVVWPIVFVAAAGAMSLYSGAPIFPALAAVAIVYVCGYVTGSLLVAPIHDRAELSLGVVRLIAGLLLTSVAFLLSLELALHWFSLPLALVALAILLRGRAALVPPRPGLALSLDGVVAGVITCVVLAPPLISAMRMAPGNFPPVFFNVDIPYFLEKVHSLVGAHDFPPESLSVVDGRRPYHFGVHAIAAVLSRGSGLAPHHAVFLMVVPLLTIGIAAAAVVLVRAISPGLPLTMAIPLLLVSVPTLWYDFWLNAWPKLRVGMSARSLDGFTSLANDWQMWGLTSNIQNLAGQFLVLGSLGAIVRAPSLGWGLAAFLIGSAVVFKSPAGVALMAGFALAQATRAVMARSLRPLLPAAAAGLVFAAIYGAFWIVPAIPQELRAALSPLFYVEYLSKHGGVQWFVMDVAWLLLPALLVLPVRPDEAGNTSLPLLAFAIAPFVVVNLLRAVDLRREFGISSMNEDDWRQIMMPVPLLLHAFVLSFVGQRWPRLGTARRSLCLIVAGLAVLPPVVVAARYSDLLVSSPGLGHEFADNRAIGDALAVIPRNGSLIVTNDLRYPADGFQRDYRQMQIPSLFGHQAFAVNYMYEAYPFSAHRLELQRLLQADEWSPAIDEAASQFHWTHLVIRKDYKHPRAIPLEQVFDNEWYSVFRFGTGPGPS